MSSHSLRLSIFFLRIALGLNFVYLGWTASLRPSARHRPARSTRSVRSITWLSALGNERLDSSWLPQVAAWAFLVVGILPHPRPLHPPRLAHRDRARPRELPPHHQLRRVQRRPSSINDELIALFCLLDPHLRAAPGNIIGVDKFLRWSKKRKE
jgi:hypothetical protein